jgi:hypothetical protein
MRYLYWYIRKPVTPITQAMPIQTKQRPVSPRLK